LRDNRPTDGDDFIAMQLAPKILKPQGDLCMRWVQQLVGPGKAVTANMFGMSAYIRGAKTARMAAGMKQKSLAGFATELCDRGYEFDKARVRHIEASKPVPFLEAENYAHALSKLAQKACVPEVVFDLRKRPRPPFWRL
jgi:hypothetical protein